jgi:hypothetical protein
MDSTDMLRAERRARLRYEWGRARRALVGFGPVLLIAVGAAALSRHPLAAAACGFVTFAAGATILWYGREAKRAVLPGVAAGFVPLALALCASHVGHGCTGDGCMMLCVPACVTGGVVAGLAVANVAGRYGAGAAFWVLASGLALLTGAMGCACAGYSGVVGLALGYGAGVVPGLLGRAFAWRSP